MCMRAEDESKTSSCKLEICNPGEVLIISEEQRKVGGARKRAGTSLTEKKYTVLRIATYVLFD